MNILGVTSCNRIEQVALSVSIFDQIVSDEYHLIIADNTDDGRDVAERTPPEVKCTDISILYDIEQYLKKAKSVSIIRCTPRLSKHRGDVVLINQLLARSLTLSLDYEEAWARHVLMTRSHHDVDLLDKEVHFIKISGAEIIRKDLFKEYEDLFEENDVLAWERVRQSEIVSTRLMACKPHKLFSYMLNNYGGVPQLWHCEDVFGDVYDNAVKSGELKVHKMGNEMDAILLSDLGSNVGTPSRERIDSLINEHSIDRTATPWLKKYANGSIF